MPVKRLSTKKTITTSAARNMRRLSSPTCAIVGEATGVMAGAAAVPATDPATGPVASPVATSGASSCAVGFSMVLAL